MNVRPIAFAAAVAAGFAFSAVAQQPAPPPPSFAAPDLTPAGVRAMAANCAGCHGTEGKAVPAQYRDLSLAGYSRESFVGGMKMYRDGKRPATIMHQIAKGYSDDQLQALATWFAAQKTK